jgi:hypothetical protein
MPVVLGADETVERRWGSKIKARGMLCYAVRLSRKHTVYCVGLRWISLLMIVKLPWSS